MINDPILELRQVRKEFPGQGRQDAVVALDGLDLALDAGEFVAIVGASGSGKSTLINLVAGFAHPTSGTVTVKGEPVRAPGPGRVVVFQDHAVFPWFTALDNVAYGLRRQGMRRRQAGELAREALAQVGFADFAHAYPLLLVASRAFADAHPEAIRAIVAGTRQAVDWINADPEAAGAATAAVTGAPASVEADMFRKMDWKVRLDDQTIDSLNKTAAFLHGIGKLKQIPNVKEHSRPELLQP